MPRAARFLNEQLCPLLVVENNHNTRPSLLHSRLSGCLAAPMLGRQPAGRASKKGRLQVRVSPWPLPWPCPRQTRPWPLTRGLPGPASRPPVSYPHPGFPHPLQPYQPPSDASGTPKLTPTQTPPHQPFPVAPVSRQVWLLLVTWGSAQASAPQKSLPWLLPSVGPLPCNP